MNNEKILIQVKLRELEKIYLIKKTRKYSGGYIRFVKYVSQNTSYKFVISSKVLFFIFLKKKKQFSDICWHFSFMVDALSQDSDSGGMLNFC